MAATSTDFFIMAALLGLFGLAATNQGGQHGPLQLLLAGLAVGAAVFLRQGTPEARVFGLAVAALTVAIGAWLLISGSAYLPGTIVAVFALFRLGAATTASPTPPAGTQPTAGLPTATVPFADPPAGTPFPGQGSPPAAPFWAAPAEDSSSE